MKPALLALLIATAPSAAGAAKELPLPGEVFTLSERTAFIIPAKTATPGKPIPWVLYAPSFPDLPGPEEKWMLTQFTEAGIAIAGIDVGESYGSPDGRALYTALHTHLTTTRGFAAKPVLLGRSRGGLMTLAWAADHPGKVAAFAGIYPVCDIASYPGIAEAAPAYRLTPGELRDRLADHNPIDRLAPLAAARIPLFAIHGDVDKTVPLAPNSALVHKRYTALGGTMQLIIPPGQGHNMWEGFFRCEELVAFVKMHARP